MDTLLMDSTAAPDDQLWHASTRGDLDAFGEIVRRYQALVCSLAYSRTGNLASSQDLAQETFVTAWRQLADLREPARLRSWLCGIVRNLAANAARVERRRGGPADGLDAIEEPASTAADPETQAVSREEEALLWRALEGMPETFREPLVLFYRQDRSIAEVALLLDLSEDAVKQRLSRGRAMLRQEMAATVESALRRSRPNAAFTTAVLGAIALAAATPGAAFAAGAVAGGGAAAATAAAAGKGTLGAAGAGVIAGPAAGLATAWLASKAVGMNARSELERAAVARHFRQAISFTFPFIALLLALIFVGRTLLETSPWFIVSVTTVWTAGLLTFLIRLGQRGQREIEQIRAATGTEDAAYEKQLAARGLRLTGGKRFVSKRQWLGLPLFAYGSSGMDIGAPTSRSVRAWIAIGDVAVSPFLAFGGLAIAPIAVGGVTIGLLSLSLGGIAVGLLAVGSIAAGWWAFGITAVGWKAAAGVAAIAHDYAVGGMVSAAAANTPEASAWFSAQWFSTVAVVWFAALPLFVLIAIVLPIGLLLRRGWQLRASKRSAPRGDGGGSTAASEQGASTSGSGNTTFSEASSVRDRFNGTSADSRGIRNAISDAGTGASVGGSAAVAVGAVGTVRAADAADSADAAETGGDGSAIGPRPVAAAHRLHALDALRAAALIGGIVLHSAMPYVLPPGLWAVGTLAPQPFLGWCVYYLHTSRLEVFFLLAGFFGALVVGRRGVAAYLRDRAIRILLVFAVALYPMKFLLVALWIAGGRATGWLKLPPEVSGLPWYVLSLGSFSTESWPDIMLTHLWFLYVLSCIVALFVAARAVVRLAVPRPADTFAGPSRLLRAAVASRAWPLLLAVVVTPLLVLMQGMDIDTPDRSVTWNLPVMALYGLFFAFGWWLHGHTDLLKIFTARWKWLLTLGLIASIIGSAGVAMGYVGGPWMTEHARAMRWATSFATSLTMAATVFGWIGLFSHAFSRESAPMRYLADASYWMYLAHLPIVVGLQVALAGSGWPWWIQLPLVNIVTAALLLASYHWGVRSTWIGLWLNGRRPRRHAQTAVPGAAGDGR